jgi:transposase
MLSLPRSVRIFLARDAVDFRKAFDGLCAIVRDEFEDDPYSGHLFVFFNRRRDRVKILIWDNNGFWLLCKRLERGTFEEFAVESRRAEIDRARLLMLLEGIDGKRARIRKHFDVPIRLTARDVGDRARSQ